LLEEAGEMKKEGRYYGSIILIALGVLVGVWCGKWGFISPALAQQRESISGITATRDFELTAELEKTWDYLQRRHFHNYIEEELPQDTNPSICFVCHGSYPHQNAKMTRAILNMHTIFLACEGCHFKPDRTEQGKKYGYRWYDGSTSLQARQRHYGTKYDPVSGVVLMESEATLFKITPYLKSRGKYYMIDLRQNNPWVQEMLGKRDRTPDEQARVKTTIHTNIETKGYECGECHTTDSILSFSKLGFDAERVKDLTGLNIVGMVQKYQKFYIPDIFKQKRLYEAPIIEERAEK
jgi:hypothetical protein